MLFWRLIVSPFEVQVIIIIIIIIIIVVVVIIIIIIIIIFYVSLNCFSAMFIYGIKMDVFM